MFQIKVVENLDCKITSNIMNTFVGINQYKNLIDWFTLQKDTFNEVNAITIDRCRSDHRGYAAVSTGGVGGAVQVPGQGQGQVPQQCLYTAGG